MRTFSSMSATFLLSLAACTVLYAQDKPSTPPGWKATGSNPGGYEYVIDTPVKHGGSASVSIRPKTNAVGGQFGSLVQAIRPDDYRGKRISFSGYVKTENVEENVQLWVRIDGPGMRTLDFSNMDTRPIKGTTDWKQYDLVVDVPADAEAIVFGVFLMGIKGRAWIDDMSLKSVAKDTPKTSNVMSEAATKEQEEELKKITQADVDKMLSRYRSLPTRPTNLDLESKDAVPKTVSKP